MFKLVVLSAFLAAVSANPGALLAPLSYSANVVASAPAVYSSNPGLIYSSPIVSTAPVAYSTPYGYSHFIKKRSAPLALSSYIAPSTYIASTPLINTYASPLATTYTAPLATTYASPLYTHLIKKRSPQYIVPSSYIAPQYAATPLVASTYASSPIVSTPLVSAPIVSSAPIAYGAHFIKKRSVPLAIATYSAPTSFSHQSRVDFQSTSPVISSYSSYPSSLAYPSAIGVAPLL